MELLNPAEITADTIIFDLDDTLYPGTLRLVPLIAERIGQYIEKVMNLPPSEADLVRTRYRDMYGVSLTGLIHHQNVDPVEYTKYVYDIDYQRVLSGNRRLRELFSLLPQRKIVYTNGSHVHAGRVLEVLGVDDHIDKIIGIEDTLFYPKPTRQSFREMIRLTDLKASESLFFDDYAPNLLTAEKFGVKTVWVDNREKPDRYIVDLFKY